MLPQIAGDMDVSLRTATLVATTFAIPYAAVQPVLGVLADMFGKARLLVICLGVLVSAAALCAVAPSFEILILGRILFGCGAGGTFPIVLAMVGDSVPVNQRQVAIARVLGASMSAIVLGAVGAGIVGDYFGWRMVFLLNGLLCGVALTIALFEFRARPIPPGPRRSLKETLGSYKTLFRHPLAVVCFGAVMVEGFMVQGFFPYVSILLQQQGEPRASIAGLVLAGWGIGGFFYSIVIARLLRHVSERMLMIIGGAVSAAVYITMSFGPPWQVALAVFILLGLSFYLLHAFIQLYVTELAPEARASALSMHSFFFFAGQACGPVGYGFGFSHFGVQPTLLIAAASLFAIAVWCALKFRRDEQPVL